MSAYNTEKVLAGETWKLDENYFWQLGEAAIPDAVRLEKSNRANAATRAGATQFLNDYEKYGLSEDEGVFAFSITRARAERALAERE